MFSDDAPPTSTSAPVPSNASGTVAVRSSRTAAMASGSEASPSTGTASTATSPSAARRISPPPNIASAARLERSSSRAFVTSAFEAPRVTTISAGSAVVPGKSRWSARKPCLETKRSGRVDTPPVPMLIPSSGTVAATRTPTEHSGQQREGRDDRDDADEDRAHREAPHDRARNDQHPEHRDDEHRAAEEHGAAGRQARGRDRVELLPPSRALLAVTRDDEERVVDPEGQAHPREHVDHEHRELERLRHERGQPEGDDDRDRRHEQRHEPRHDRAEHEQQDDQRRRQSEAELAVLEILLREEIEVVVERLVAGHRDREGGILVRPLDRLDDRLGLVLVDDPDDREDEDGGPGADRPPRVPRAGRGETLRREHHATSLPFRYRCSD